MVFAVDSNVLLDVLTNDPQYADASIGVLSDAAFRGELIASDVVFAETSSMFPGPAAFQRQMKEFGIRFVPTKAPRLGQGQSGGLMSHASSGVRACAAVVSCPIFSLVHMRLNVPMRLSHAIEVSCVAISRD